MHPSIHEPIDTPAPLLPRRLIFGHPERSVVRISPDGTRIAFLAPVGEVLNLWIAPTDRVDEASPVTQILDRNLGPWIVWMYDNRHVVFFREQSGDENWRAWRVDLQTKHMCTLTPGPGVASYVQQISPSFPRELLIAHNQRDRSSFDIYRVDVATGKSGLVQVNDKGFAGFVTDHQFRVRYAVRHEDDGGVRYLEQGSDGDWTTFNHILPDDAMTTHPVEFSFDGRELFWLDSRGRDTAAVLAQDLATGTMRQIWGDDRADCTIVTFDPVTNRPIAAATAFCRTRWQVLDPAYEADFANLSRDVPGDIAIVGMSRDRRHWLIARTRDDKPLEYVHYDRQAGQARRLFSSNAVLERAPLAPMDSITIKSRDGLDLVCYLSLPRTSHRTVKLPMVLLVHGGPWARNVWGLHPDHQWLANRGYAVLSVNFRGSTGFGKAFVNAGNLEWGRRMHDDLIDAVDWAVGNSIADPSRVAIMGTSYGGYAALVGVTFTPEKFTCAIDLFGISNIVTFLNAIPPQWLSWKSVWKVRVGDDTTDAGRQFLEERSPLSRAHSRNAYCRALYNMQAPG